MGLIILRRSFSNSRVGLRNMCLLIRNTTTMTKFTMITVLFKMVNVSTIGACSINSGAMFKLRLIRVVSVGCFFIGIIVAMPQDADSKELKNGSNDTTKQEVLLQLSSD